MGRKIKNTGKKMKQTVGRTPQDQSEEFTLNLKALEGYDLPVSDEKNNEDQQPKTKKLKTSRPEILGIDYREREEKRLEKLLFGEVLQKFEAESQIKAEPTSAKSGGKNKQKKQASKSKPGKGKDALPEDVYGKHLGISSTVGRKVAWVDEDDSEIKLKNVIAEKGRGKGGDKAVSETVYKQFLEKKFATVHGQITPKWAQLSNKEEKKAKTGSDDEDDDDNEHNAEGQDLTKTATNLLRRDSTHLTQNIIKINRLKDINKETKVEGSLIKSVEFHKKQNVALVAGNSGVLSLFQIGGVSNPKIQSISFERFPIYKARFSADGEELIASSNMTGNIQVHNLTTGKATIIPHNKQMENGSYKNFELSPDGKVIAFQGRFGYIHLMSARSKEWITSLKMNGNVHSMTFNADGTKLYSHGEFGEVYVWDMQSRRCVHKFVDDGCITGTAIAISSTQQYLACGSNSGVVNVYDTSKLENKSLPQPEKAIMNLVTEISGIMFHPSSELMSIFSDKKENAVRLVHFPSMTVFKNFPNENKGTPRFASMDFSPSGGYMAAGLNNGSAHLYRLNHYGQY